MLVGKQNGFANPDGLLQIVTFVRFQQGNVAIENGVGGVYVAVDLGFGGFAQLFVALDVNFRAQLFALVGVEDAQGNADTGSDSVQGVGVVVGAIVGIPQADGGIGRAVSLGQLVVGFCLLHREYGGAQVRAGVERLFAIVVEREQVLGEIERSVDVVALDRPAIVEHGQQVDLGGAKVDQRGLHIGFVLQALEFEAVEVDLGDVAGLVTFAADLQDLVVVAEIILGEVEDGFGLQDADEGAAQIEDQSAFGVGLLGGADGGALLGGLITQPAFVASLE